MNATTDITGAKESSTNPFEDDSALYLVVVNGEKQHALWPAQMPVPAGWHTALQAATRAACLAYVEAHWTDIRPASIQGSV
ncbi:MbtH family protein [Streptomyces sp. NPDC056337]|uniref:MbtH family protein n=1 Tax=Streptomyces sp. NPDC056337 TaxID=3345787 RepID=UPI0035D52C79